MARLSEAEVELLVRLSAIVTLCPKLTAKELIVMAKDDNLKGATYLSRVTPFTFEQSTLHLTYLREAIEVLESDTGGDLV